MRRTIVGALLACSLVLPGAAGAQDWPARPITMVVPFAAGGPIDVVARIITPRMSELLGQQLVVDNIPGAGGMVGASRVSKASPDGYTILLGNQGTHTYSQFIYKKPLYNPVTAFAPGGLVVSNTKVLVVRKDLPVKHAARVHRLREGEPGADAATAPPAAARPPTSPACCSTPRWAPTSSTCPIAAPARRCRT